MSEQRQGWFKKLQTRWGVTAGRAVIILIVFACTGFTVMFLKQPIVSLIIGDGEETLWQWILYLIFIFPVYLTLLLFYGFLFGQYSFFKSFVKKSASRMTGKRKKVKSLEE